MNDAVCRDELGAIPSIERSGCADWASLESAMRSVPLSTRDGLWESCGRRLCTGNPVADGFAQPLQRLSGLQPAIHPVDGPAAPSLAAGVLKHVFLSPSPLSFLPSPSLPFPSFCLSLFFSSLFFPSPSFLSFSTDHLLVSLGKPHWSRSGGCLKVGSLNTEQPPQGCLAVRLLGESCLS